MKESLLWIFESIWPMIVISLVIIISARLYYIFKNKTKIILYNELLMLSAIIYMMCLFYVVTFPDTSASWSTSNFIPFKEMFRYKFLSRLFIKNVLGNLFMFIPFGFFISYILKIVKAKHAMIFSIITSLTIEITQLCIGRVFDIDDVLLNILGGVIGFYLYYFFHIVKQKSKILNIPLIYNALTVISIGLFTYASLYILIF